MIAFVQQPDAVDVLIVPAAPVLPQVVPRPEIPVDADNCGYVGGAGRLGVGAVRAAWPSVGAVGTGTTSTGLVPESVRSVEPSGIPTLPDDDPAAVGSAADVPDDEMAGAVEPQVPDNVAPMPPPSKVDVDPAVPEPGIPTSEHVALPMELSGLMPPGSSSTAPNGIAVPPGGASGDVVPIAGAAIVLTCARLGPPGKTAATIMAISTYAMPECLVIAGYSRSHE